MQHRISDFLDQIQQLQDRVKGLDHPIARGDLTRFLAHAQQLWQQLDCQLVECRRLGQYTLHYDRVEAQLQAQLTLISKWLTWALLKWGS